MIVIATNNGYNNLPRLLASLEITNLSNIPISIIDTGSTDKNSIDYLNNLSSKYKVYKINGGYDTGAYIYAYENIKADYYIFFQDSIEIKTEEFFRLTLAQIEADYLFAYYSFNRGDFEEILSQFYDFKSIQSYKWGVFGPMFACSYKVMSKLYNSKLYIIPKDKMEQMTMERGWGIMAYILDIPLVSLGDYSSLLNNTSPYIIKHFNKRK